MVEQIVQSYSNAIKKAIFPLLRNEPKANSCPYKS